MEADQVTTSAFEELTQLASEGGRKIFIAQHQIDLRTKEGRNCVYVLELPIGRSGAAGGGIMGIAERTAPVASLQLARAD